MSSKRFRQPCAYTITPVMRKIKPFFLLLTASRLQDRMGSISGVTMPGSKGLYRTGKEGRSMPLTIYGAGAIGGSLGAYLVRAGEAVLFVDNNREHVQAINTHGLKIDGVRGEFVVSAKAVLPSELSGPLETVLLAVKSQHTVDALSQLLPHLTPASLVVSLQNGLNEEIIAQRIGAERTIGAFINWAADYIGPGHIRHGGEGSLYLGELDGSISPRLVQLQKTLSAFLPVQITSNIWGYLWAKQVYGSLLFATALADLPVYEVVADPVAHAVLGDLIREAMQVPAALGISVESFDEFDPLLFQQHRDEEALEKIATHFRGQIKTKTGVWRDIAVRRRRTEVEGIIGMTVQKGEALGLSLPLHRQLIRLIHELEEGKRSMDLQNFQVLGAIQS
ncbi:MAG: 2-dehydropantoate 2-reductase [Nitrospinota bacterium]|nr:MAG: 2-dehydropantoate 2-reductase [Nitrospinota bacterium]